MSSILCVKSVSIAVGVVVIYIEVVVVDGSNHFTYKKDDSKAHQSMRKQSYAAFHALLSMLKAFLHSIPLWQEINFKLIDLLSDCTI